MASALSENFGNPSSLHGLGQECKSTMNIAKETILSALGDRSPLASKLIVCGSGTEANNLAILGTAYAKEKNRGKRFITTDSEHPSVLRCFEKLGREGYDVVYLSTKGGVIDMEEFSSSLTPNTVFVSVMLVNNETGAEYPVKEIFDLVKKKVPEAVTHTDATQGFLKTGFSLAEVRADLVTVSAHKIHGPKGIGALYVSPDIIRAKKLSPVVFGGGQENGFRSGTENTASLIGFAEACRHRPDTGKIAKLREYIISSLPEEVKVNAPLKKTAPHILNIMLPKIKSQVALNFFSSRDIYLSSGSACSSHSAQVSYVLTAFGISRKDADFCLRISLCEENTVEEADTFISVLKDALGSLIRAR